MDDTAGTLCGTLPQIWRAIDVLVIWWLVLGAPTSWSKCELRDAWEATGHLWIGVVYHMGSPNRAVLTLPAEFVSNLFTDLPPFASALGTVCLRMALKVAEFGTPCRQPYRPIGHAHAGSRLLAG